MDKILSEIRNCIVCKDFLPNVPRPIIQASSVSKIVIIGQAPGQKVQNSGIPWDDASGNNLREWLGVDKQAFYNEKVFALILISFQRLVRSFLSGTLYYRKKLYYMDR